jgi:mono/diheme cytochrome c family protein
LNGGGLIRRLALAALGAAAGAQAQDAAMGKRLFEDTPNVSGINTLTGACTSCHGTVENRRTKIGGGPYAEISVATATERFRLAIASVGAMNQFDALSVAQVNDIAAYLADTPTRSATQLDFMAPAVNTASATQFVDLRHAVATSETLHVTSVGVSGAGAARFTRTSDTCDQQTLAPAVSCRVTMSYSAPDTAGATGTLTFTLRQGSSSTDFIRAVALSGAVTTTPPPTTTPPASDSGGGGSGAGWLAALALANTLLWRARRRSIDSSSRSRKEGR